MSALLLPKPIRPVRVRQPLRRGAPLKRGKRPNPKRETPLARQEAEADRLWSAIVMAEAEGICEPCRFLYGETHQADDPAHIVSRRYQATKHLPSNGVAACRRMHLWLKDHPPGREDSRMKAFATAYRGEFVFGTLERLALKPANFDNVNEILESLKTAGSVAAPGFMKPEGVVAFHSASGTLYKATCEKDEKPKGQSRVTVSSEAPGDGERV